MKIDLLLFVLLISISNLFSFEWTEIESPYGNKYWTDIHFFDSTNILMTQRDRVMAYSNDLGITWQDPYYPDDSPHFQNYNDFHGDYGYSTGHDLFNDDASIYKFTNFGLDYEEVAIIEPHNCDNLDEELFGFNDHTFYFQSYYYKTPMDQGFELYKTNNSGLTWEKRKVFSQRVIEHFYIIDDNTNYIYFSNSNIERSDSNVYQWENLSIKANSENAFAMHDRFSGYYANQNKLIYTSNSWLERDTIIFTDEISDIESIKILNRDIIYLAFKNGVIYRSNNSGDYWEFYDSLTLDYEFDLENIQIIDEDKIVCKVREKGDDYLPRYYYNYSLISSVNNDFTDLINISNNIISFKKEVENISIIDLIGIKYDIYSINNIDIKSFSNGLYILQFEYNNQLINYKFIK